MGFNTQQVGNITEIQPATSGFNLGVNSEIENETVCHMTPDAN